MINQTGSYQGEEIFNKLQGMLLEIGSVIDNHAEKQEENGLLGSFLSRQLTSIVSLLDQIQYHIMIYGHIGVYIAGTILGPQNKTQQQDIIKKKYIQHGFKESITKDLTQSIYISTCSRNRTFNSALLYFTITVRTNFENFTNIIFDTVYPDKELQKRQELEKDIKTTFGKEIDIENHLTKKFIKDRCKEYPFTNKLDLICKNILNKEEIDGLKDLYNQRNSLHGLGVSKDNEVKHFKKGEENNLIIHINNILDLTTECAKKVYNKYTKDNYDLKDITGIKQKDITGFEHTYEIKETTI